MVLTKSERRETYWSAGILTVAAASLSLWTLFETKLYHRMLVAAGGGAFSGAAIALISTVGQRAERHGKLADNYEWEAAGTAADAAIDQLYRLVNPRLREPQLDECEEVAALPPSESENNFYDWKRLEKDASGLIIAGGTGYGKSSVAKWVMGLFTQKTPAKITCLDPHSNANNWQELGLEPIWDFPEIEATLARIEAELDKRRKPGSDPSSWFPWVVLCDELGGCFDNFKKTKDAQRILRRLGSEGRKYGILGILLNQSNNCAALGIDSKYRANFTMISLGEMARELFKKGTPERSLLNSTAYPCVVSGNIPLKIAAHPTHGTYQEFEKEGIPPIGLLPIQQLKNDSAPTKDSAFNSNPIDVFTKPVGQQMASASVFSASEWSLLLIANMRNSLSVKEALETNIAANEKWESNDIKAAFCNFVKFNQGSIKKENDEFIFIPALINQN